MTTVTPDPAWHVRRYEPAPTRWVGALTVADDARDPERDGGAASPARRADGGVVTAASRTTATDTDHS